MNRLVYLTKQTKPIIFGNSSVEIETFLLFTIFTDEENVIEETKRHKQIYFPKLRNNHNEKLCNKQENMKVDKVDKPVNYLFSNENQSNDDDSE